MVSASFDLDLFALNVCALSKCEMNVSRKYLARKINFGKICLEPNGVQKNVDEISELERSKGAG